MSESLPPSVPAGAPLTPDEERRWASFAHLGGIIIFLPGLIIWLMFRERGAFVREESRKALNFQITAFAAWIANGILAYFLPPGITSLVYLAIWVVATIFSVQGFMRAQKGDRYTYPLTLDLVK